SKCMTGLPLRSRFKWYVKNQLVDLFGRRRLAGCFCLGLCTLGLRPFLQSDLMLKDQAGDHLTRRCGCPLPQQVTRLTRYVDSDHCAILAAASIRLAFRESAISHVESSKV